MCYNGQFLVKKYPDEYVVLKHLKKTLIKIPSQKMGGGDLKFEFNSSYCKDTDY